MSESYHYNYVFYNVDSISEIFLSRLRNLENVKIPPSNFLTNFAIPNNHFLRRRTFHKMYDASTFCNKSPICFVFLGGLYAIKNNGYVEYIKARDKRNKVVFMLQDIMARKLLRPDMQNFDLLRPKTDLITTYDEGDARKYGFTYMPEVFYESLGKVTEPTHFDVDLLFLGHRKERLNFLLDIARHLSSLGVRCDFTITGVDEADRVQIEGVTYADEHVPYADYIARIQRSRCILEIAQAGSVAPTLRTSEAIVYHRKLLTNRGISPEANFLPDSQIKEITSIDTIDVGFLRANNNYCEFLEVDWKQEDRLAVFERCFQEG